MTSINNTDHVSSSISQDGSNNENNEDTMNNITQTASPQIEKSKVPLKSIIEKAKDDFFAFNDDSSDEDDKPKKKKKKKSKDKLKNGHSDHSKRSIKGHNVSADLVDLEGLSSPNSDSFSGKSITIDSTINDNTKTNSVISPIADLTFLGLSEDQPISDTPKPLKNLRKKTTFSPNKKNGRTLRSASNVELIESESDFNDTDDDDVDSVIETHENDEFLTQINNQLSKGLEVISSSFSTPTPSSGSPTINPTSSTETQYVDFNGRQMKITDVLFELNINFESPTQYQVSFKVRVKGSTRINKIILKSKQHIEATSKLSFKEMGIEDINDLIFVLPDYKLTLQKLLRISSVINKLNLKYNEVGDSYELNVLLVTASMAQEVQNRNSNNLSSSSLVLNSNLTQSLNSSGKIHNDDDDEEIIIKFNDKSIETIIDLDASDDDLEGSSTPSSDNIHTVVLKKNGSFYDLQVAFLSLMQYPVDLNLFFKIDGKQLDQFEVDDNFEAVGIIDGCTIDVEYDLNQLNEIKAKNKNYNTNYDDLINGNNNKDSKTDNIDLPNIDFGNGSGSLEAKDPSLKSFTIKLKGQKDPKPLECKVNKDTILSNVLNYYVTKSNLSNSLKIKLLFDDEEMNLNAKIGDTELEEDDLVDVVY